MEGKKTRKTVRIKAWGLVLALALVASLLSACGPIANPPSLKISVPDGEPKAGAVTVSVDVSNFELTGQPDGVEQGRGHIIFYIDSDVPTYYDHKAISHAGTYAITSETFHVFADVTPGEHTFSAQLVYGNDTPLPSPVVDSVTVTVGPPAGEPKVSAMVPTDGSTLPPGNIVFSISVENFIISQADMGVESRAGEGHLIYYLDEQPPTDAGVPATTDTSVVSVQTSCLWRDVKEGSHVFYAQLVNNDDTPLETPLVFSVKVDVKA